MKTHTFHDPIFQWKHTFLYGSRSQARKEMARRGFEEEPPRGEAWCITNKDSRESFIWVRVRQDYAAAAHECLHSALDVFDKVGALYDANNSESLCYYVQSLMDAYIEGKRKELYG
jgi:hypothetical protein